MKEILLKIIQEPLCHARWLNTLSYLEFLGTRKIARSALPQNQDEVRLRHLAEEARHAHFFKRMILRLADTNSKEASPFFAEQSALEEIAKDYALKNLFCGGAAGRYFHGLDAFVRDTLRKNRPASRPLESELCYLYVTLLVEERAGAVYPLYDALLREARLPIRLAGLLGEEERHLSDMKTALLKHPLHQAELLALLKKEEERLFVCFQKRMEEGLAFQKAA